MKKNLLIIHLESLNHLLFSTRFEFFFTINELKEKSMYFSNYYSSATSTLMVIGDILYGGMEQYEECQSLDYVPDEYYYETSVFDELKADGYNTGLFIYPEGGDRQSAEERHLSGFNNKMELKTKYDVYLRSIEMLMESEPFAIMSCNYISNVGLSMYTDEMYPRSGFERWKDGYLQMDKCVSDLLGLLKKKELLDNTIVLLYGDHGDDFWGHGFHKGLTHAIEPYAHLIHTPLLIYASNITPSINGSLLSSIDLRDIICNLIKGEQIDTCIKRIENEVVYSRSAYSGQPIRRESFNKAYSVSDGEFLLLVSNAGVEMYSIVMDPQCTFNYLSLFYIENEVLSFDGDVIKNLSFHFGCFFNLHSIQVIRQRYYYLKSKLYSEVKRLYLIGKRTENDLCEEMAFEKINYRR